MVIKKIAKTCLSWPWFLMHNLKQVIWYDNQNIPTDSKELNEIREHAKIRTDINDHLTTLFFESLPVNPKLIVELGVRGGESYFVLERVAKLCDSVIVSVDIDDCSHVGSYDKWFFIQKDDTQFAKEFKEWCKAHNLNSAIDIIFIDTSHNYQHTVEEIALWFPFLSEKAKVFFHDTNSRKVYLRKDGSMGHGWDNQRGVIRALEKYFNVSFNENDDFVSIIKGMIIKHSSYCNGFTILERLPF